MELSSRPKISFESSLNNFPEVYQDLHFDTAITDFNMPKPSLIKREVVTQVSESVIDWFKISDLSVNSTVIYFNMT